MDPLLDSETLKASRQHTFAGHALTSSSRCSSHFMPVIYHFGSAKFNQSFSLDGTNSLEALGGAGLVWARGIPSTMNISRYD